MKNLLILDTETTGDLTQPLIYDFGYRIITPTGQVLFSQNALVKEVFENRFIMDKAFYSQKVKEYQRKLDNGEIEIERFEVLIKEFIKMARRYKVEIIGAYNLAFDSGALNGTMRMCYSKGHDDKILEKLTTQKNKKLLCIMNLACETIFLTDEYREFADLNGLKTDKGNYKTSAEAAYRYIKDLPDFVESHTALADVDIEIEILLAILKDYTGVISYGLHYNSWRKAQKKRE